jgi:large subunit ribosomal protein L4
MKSVFSAKVKDNELFILDELKFAEPKTKDMVAVLNNLKIGKTLVVIDENDKNVVKSVSNIPTAKCTLVSTLNVYEMSNMIIC